MRSLINRIQRVEAAMNHANSPMACPCCKGLGVLSITYSDEFAKGCLQCGKVSVHMIIGSQDDPASPDPVAVGAGI